MESLLEVLGEEVVDPEEESFLLFSQPIPSQTLGFVDSKATVLQLAINDRDLTIHQSPTILSSNRARGTTGAVVWKITPLFASWITSPTNLLFRHAILDSNSSVLELGCGISGIIGLSLAPIIGSFVLTDQEYVLKLLNQNLSENQPDAPSSTKRRKGTTKPKRGSAHANQHHKGSSISAKSLDWETHEVTASLTGSESNSFDAVLACDCIYNDTLIDPLVQTCIDVCRLRNVEKVDGKGPTVCIVAQQLRSAEVFEGWLKAFFEAFMVWRVPDEELIDGLISGSGFVIHLGILRQQKLS